MKITQDDISHIANLSRLNLSDSELIDMTNQLGTILSYIDKLEEIDTTDVMPTTHVFAENNAFREDEVRPSLSQHDALHNAPQADGETFLVPKIL